MNDLRKRSFVVFALLLLCDAAAATGSVCIGPVPVATSGQKTLANATASDKAYDFSVSVDKRPAIALSHTESIAIADIELGQRHRVAIRQGGKPSASFTFTFEEHGTDRLCLWFGPLYESWSLWPLDQSKGKCDCDVKPGA